MINKKPPLFRKTLKYFECDFYSATYKQFSINHEKLAWQKLLFCTPIRNNIIFLDYNSFDIIISRKMIHLPYWLLLNKIYISCNRLLSLKFTKLEILRFLSVRGLDLRFFKYLRNALCFFICTIWKKHLFNT